MFWFPYIIRNWIKNKEYFKSKQTFIFYTEGCVQFRALPRWKDSEAPLVEQYWASEGPDPRRGIILWWHIQGHLGKRPHVPPSVSPHQSTLSVCLYAI